MSIREEFAKIIEQRIIEDKKCLPELPDYRETSPVIKEEIELFTRNLRETVYFIAIECTGDELTWLMEVSEEVTEILQSRVFIDAIYRAAERNPKEAGIHNVLQNIHYAIGRLNDNVYYQRHPEEREENEKEK